MFLYVSFSCFAHVRQDRLVPIDCAEEVHIELCLCLIKRCNDTVEQLKQNGSSVLLRCIHSKSHGITVGHGIYNANRQVLLVKQ